MVRCECRVVGLLNSGVHLAVQGSYIPNIAGTYHPIKPYWGTYGAST